MHEYLRFDLIHQLITAISGRPCGTKAQNHHSRPAFFGATACEWASLTSARVATDRRDFARRRSPARQALRPEEESQTDRLTDGHLAKTWPSASPQVSRDHSSVLSCCLSLYHSQSHALNRHTATCRQTVKTPETQSELGGPLFSFQLVYFSFLSKTDLCVQTQFP